MRAAVLQTLKAGLQTTSVRAIRRSESPALAKPPLVTRFEGFESYWQLFDQFLRYVSRFTQRSRSPISQCVQFINQLVPPTLDVQGLCLGVAVEALLRAELEASAKPPTTDEFARGLDAVKNLVQAEEGIPETIRRRVCGAIDSMHGVRAKDLLLKLVDDGVISRYQYDAWTWIRNRTAHGLVNVGDYHDFLRHCEAVRALFYCLVFRVIDYHGQFTDYSTAGGPTRTFPVVSWTSK